MSAPIALHLDPQEQHMLAAALSLYEALMASAHEVGGDARDTAAVFAPIAARVSRRLEAAMYPEPRDPWTPPGWDVELAKGDHHIGIGR